MIIVSNIEYNFIQHLVDEGFEPAFEQSQFNVDSFKSEEPDALIVQVAVTAADNSDQSRSVQRTILNIKRRAELEHTAKESLYTLYENKNVFGFGKTLPEYNDGNGFTVTEKATSMIKATNAPSFLETDDNGNAIYLMSVEIIQSASI